MSASKVIDLVAAWRRRGRVIAVPEATEIGEYAAKQRVAEGLCAVWGCKRKLKAGTERCRKCGDEIAAREAKR